MRIVGEVLSELFGMFVADARLTLAVLCLVAVVAGLVGTIKLGPLLAGGILLFGCLAIIVEAVAREARARGQR